jgi:aryl-alcohol dehydrogenase-like predicted oxidoreductase
MRYRPLGPTGMAISVVSLRLDDGAVRPRPTDWQAFLFAAFERGINAFEIVGRHPALIEGLGLALEAVERRLVFVSLRLGVSPARDFSPDGMRHLIDSVITRTGMDYLDAVVLDDPHSEELSPYALETLRGIRQSGRARMLGVGGEDEAIDAYISMGAFDLLHTPFSLTSGWKERLRLKAALEHDMGVIGYGYYPEGLIRAPAAAPQRMSLFGGRSNPLAHMGGYAFLHEMANWDCEALCLAYALTEPSLASVQISVDSIDALEALAAVSERDLPPGLGAQIEMARFGASTKPGKTRRA